MEFRQLRYVVTLAETLHFGRAAQREFITQSTFSQQIARLEREVGALLFERSSRVTLTPLGELFVKHARKILANLATMESEVHNAVRGSVQRLSVGVFAEGAGELTPLIFQTFRDIHPQVQLEIVELSFTGQVNRVADGTVDIAIVRMPISDPRLELRVLFAEPCFAALPINHPSATADSLR